jgi:hypothetical protein
MSVGAWGQGVVVTGVVSDPDSNRVPGAPVEAKNTATGVMARAMTNTKGEYTLSVPAGTYDFSVAMPCCQWGTSSQKAVVLRTGEKRSLDIRLPWGANLGTLGDDPILALNAFRGRAAIASGPTPRTSEGKPDLSGIWINTYDPDMPNPPLNDHAAQILRERAANGSKDYPGGYCLPASASSITRYFPYKFVQTPKLIVVIHESDTPGVRQIFMDGRGHPRDWNPTWQGHSTGRWEGDTLVVDTVGFNDKAWLSLSGIPHSDKLHTVERIRRLDYGHLEVQIVMEDPEMFTAPWKRVFAATLAEPDAEILEYICNENNVDPGHYRGR